MDGKFHGIPRGTLPRWNDMNFDYPRFWSLTTLNSSSAVKLAGLQHQTCSDFQSWY
jgi:hypothetical protein